MQVYHQHVALQWIEVNIISGCSATLLHFKFQWWTEVGYPCTIFFFFLAPFFRVSLWPGLFYWSVSRLPGLLRSGLEGGWERWRGGVLRRAPGLGWAGFPPRWCGLSNLGRASWPRRRAWRHGWAKQSIGRWGLLLGMFAKAGGLVVLWLGPVVWETWMLLHSIGPPFQFRAPQVGSDGSRWVPGRSVPSSSSHPATRPL